MVGFELGFNLGSIQLLVYGCVRLGFGYFIVTNFALCFPRKAQKNDKDKESDRRFPR